MKRYIFTAMAMFSMILAGCDSDKSECTNDNAKADCSEGKYSLCVDGKWEEATCKDGASCNAENQCGECKNDDVKKDCSDGKYSKCVNGQWESTECANKASCKADGTCGDCTNDAVKDCENGEDKVGKVTICQNGQWSASKVECQGASGKVSCTADKVCGECLTGDSTKCEDDDLKDGDNVKKVGNATMCKDGKWTTEPDICPGQNSCAMTGDCYQCYQKCDKDRPCDGTDCKYNNACKKECGDCDSKCGECNTGDHKNCVEDSNGKGSADYCVNGTWKSNVACENIGNIRPVSSCTRTCRDSVISCAEEEKISVCGECKNTEAGKYLCVAPDNPLYGGRELLGDYTQINTCENGQRQFIQTCPAGICDENTGQCD